MTPEILENNKLIAVYDGWKFVNDDEEAYPHGYWLYETEQERCFKLPEEFEYHSSWDWLMPVILKIMRDKSTNFMLADPGYLHINDQFIFDLAPDLDLGVISYNQDPLTAAYNGIVRFIKLNNEKK